MKALGFKQLGDIKNFEIFETSKPQVKSGEVLVEIKASALNYLDILVVRGLPGLKLDLPHISGGDGAGIIIELGQDVEGFSVGDRVVIDPGINLYQDEFTQNGEHSISPGYKILGEHLPGTHTEFISVPAQNLVKLPESVSFDQAVACGLVGLTAWRMLIHRAQLNAGEKVLILGAGGGVNSMSIQLAKLCGCEVYVITSTKAKAVLAKELGADVAINYKTDQEWEKILFNMSNKQGFDVVIDNVGAATLNASIRIVKPGGRIVIVGNTSGHKCEIDIPFLFVKQISLIGSTMGNHYDFQKIMQLLFTGKIKPVIYKSFHLNQGVEALTMMARGEQFGKYILTR